MGNQIARTASRTKIDLDLPPSQRNDRFLTPKHIVDALGKFDLDPCGAPGHVLAKHTYLLENGDDGLRDPWEGRVFMNPPYGAKYIKPWAERLIEHNNGIMLIPANVGTKLWQDLIFPTADAVHFYRHRITFHHRDPGARELASPQASAFVAYGDTNVEALLTSDLPGFVVDFTA